MTAKPTLIVMAAGMGSRYGGLKQIDPITDQGEIILDFSLYDAMMAGFEDVVFIIKKENEADFRALIDERAGRRLNIKYAYQDILDVPGGGDMVKAAIQETIDKGRTKPWGTGHAVLSARNLVTGPFAVINADDFYGAAAFQHMYEFLHTLGVESAKSHNVTTGAPRPKLNEEPSADALGESSATGSTNPANVQHFAMVGYRLDKTLSETGHVARGVCTVTEDSMLKNITERTKIQRQASGEIAFSEDGGETWTVLPDDTPVSMNFWGFGKYMMDALEMHFPEILAKILSEDPLKGEYYLPGAVDNLLRAGKADVKVLRSSDQWYGVTYKEDKPGVMDAIRAMKDRGLYPEKLWD